MSVSIIDMQCCPNLKGLNTIAINGVAYGFDIAKMQSFLNPYNGSTPTVINAVTIGQDVYFKIVGEYELTGYANGEDLGFVDLANNCKHFFQCFTSISGSKINRNIAVMEMPKGVLDSFADVRDISYNIKADALYAPNGDGVLNSFIRLSGDNTISLAKNKAQKLTVKGMSNSFTNPTIIGSSNRFNIYIDELLPTQNPANTYCMKNCLTEHNDSNYIVNLNISKSEGDIINSLSELKVTSGGFGEIKSSLLSHIGTLIQTSLSKNISTKFESNIKCDLPSGIAYIATYKENTLIGGTGVIIQENNTLSVDTSFEFFTGDFEVYFKGISSGVPVATSDFGKYVGSLDMYVKSSFASQTWYTTAKSTNGFNEIILP